jgi:CheY-like chemotaxis protein
MTSSKRVLLVDDDPLSREAIRTALEQTFVSVEEASNGLEAIAMLHERRFDYVVVDLKIPIVSAYEVLRHAKTKSPSADPIALSEAAGRRLTTVRPGLVSTVMLKSEAAFELAQRIAAPAFEHAAA